MGQEPKTKSGLGVPAKLAELKDLAAQRASAIIGLPVRIEDLRYNVLASRIVGEGIEAGPTDRPLLRLPELVVELSLLSASQGGAIGAIQASGARLALPSSWFTRPMVLLPHRDIAVRVVRIHKGQLVVQFPSSKSLAFEDIDATLEDLALPAAAAVKSLSIRGAFSLKATIHPLSTRPALTLGIKGRLVQDHLDIEELRLAGNGIRISLHGTIGLRRKKLGPFALRGTANLSRDGAKDPWLRGVVKMAGPSLGSLVLEVDLKGEDPLTARRGSFLEVPLLRLKGKVGSRRSGAKKISGTLESWILR
jgi:hypothetical protein